MSKSRRKTAKRSITTATSEKSDKRLANRLLRKKVKQDLLLDKDIFPTLREVSNVWAFAKDGKIYDLSISDKLMRK